MLVLQVAKLQEEVRRLQDEVAAGGRGGSRDDCENERTRQRVRGFSKVISTLADVVTVIRCLTSGRFCEIPRVREQSLEWLREKEKLEERLLLEREAGVRAREEARESQKALENQARNRKRPLESHVLWHRYCLLWHRYCRIDF